MIIQVYVLLMILAFVFIGLGYALKNDAHIYKIAGFTLVFILGVMLIPEVAGSLEYVSGSTVVENGTGFIITDILSSYENRFIGFSLACCSVFGFVNVFYQMRRTNER